MSAVSPAPRRGVASDLGSRLLASGRIDAEGLAAVRARQAASGERFADALLTLGLLGPDELLAAYAEFYALPLRPHFAAAEIDPALTERLPIGFCKQHALLPLAYDPDGALRVAVSDPLAGEALDDLRLLFEAPELRLELAPQRAILAAINEVYDRGPASTDALVEDAAEDLEHLAHELGSEPEDLLESADDAPIIKLVNSLLQHAVKERASDIHIEPFEREIRVRLRIDDVLYEAVKPLPRSLQASIVSRIKIMGGLNIAEKRLPQDGRIRLKIAGRDYDVRLSTIPVAFGERVVLRLLPRSQEMLDLARIGFERHQLDVIEQLITRPNGILLVTGPTGSGKTTTLYAALSQINSTDKNIITIEDPVEIQLTGVGQIEVKPQIGLTFAGGLRSVLRQDPNVILVGEIRDLETAEIAIQASLTGHLVFSTLHTNDAASAITRLVDMGVEPFLVASSLVAVLAQRLVRVLCRECRQSAPASDLDLAQLGLAPGRDPVLLYQPVGCPRCNHTGYRGRVGIFELMRIDDELRALVSRNIDSKTIKHTAQQKGMKTLRADGARKVLQGITSLAEVLRATEDEGVVAQV